MYEKTTNKYNVTYDLNGGEWTEATNEFPYEYKACLLYTSRESKTHQLDAAIASGAAQGMRTMDMALADLVRQKRITEETALYYCTNYETMQKRLQLL